jgi:type I restriction enzyme, R subunit
MSTEADTCRKYVVPKHQAAGWDTDPHSIAEQRYFTAGRIVVHGHKATRRPGKRADYLLRYTRDLILAVVEAKDETGAELVDLLPGILDRAFKGEL